MPLRIHVGDENCDWQNLLFGICGLGHFDPKKEPWKSTQVDKELDFGRTRDARC